MKNVEQIIKKGIIKNKADYYFLYERGFFGNKVLTWNSLEEIEKSGWDKGICIRGTRGIPRDKARYNFNFEEAKNYVGQLKREGIPPEKLTFNQSMPDEELTIQGEIMRSKNFYELTYSTIKEPMNRALEKETLHAEGLTALNLIKNNFCPSSYANLQNLFDLFSDSVIEFSCYRIPVGNLKNRNTIIWEVRNY